MPTPASITHALASYESSWSQEGQTLTIQRNLMMFPPQAVISVEDYQGLRKMAAQVVRDQRAALSF